MTLRIVSLLASATEMLCELGLGDQIVAISHECNFPGEILDRPRVTRSRIAAEADSAAIDRQVKSLLAAGQPLYELDEAALAALRPDLVVTQSQCDVCAVRYEDVLTTVRRTPALARCDLVALNPTSLDDVLQDMGCLGEAAGVAARAADCIAALHERIDAIQRRTAPLAASQRPRTAMIEWVEPIMLAGHWMPQLVELAGGRHGLTTPGRPSPYVDWNGLTKYDPEVVVVAPCGFDLTRTRAEATSLFRLPGWSELAAVRDRRAWAVDGDAYFNRAGPRLVESLEILAFLLQPGLFDPPNLAGGKSSYGRL